MIMSEMRAAVLVAPKRFELQTRAIPQPKPDEVLVKIERVGICGTDMHIFHGHYAADKLPLTLIRRLAATAFFVLAVVAVYKAMVISGWV